MMNYIRFIKLIADAVVSMSLVRVNNTSVKKFNRLDLIKTLELYKLPENSNLETNRNFFMKVVDNNIIIVRQDTIGTIKVDVFNGESVITKANIFIPETNMMNIVIDNDFIKILLNNDFILTYNRFNLTEIIESIDLVEYDFGFDTIDAEFNTLTPFGLNVSESDIVIVDGNRFIEFDFESVLYGTFDFIELNNLDQIISIKSYTENSNTTLSSNSMGYFVIGLSDGLQKNFYSLNNQFIEYENGNQNVITVNKLNQYENIFDILNRENNEFNRNSNTIYCPVIDELNSNSIINIFKKNENETIVPLNKVNDNDSLLVLTNEYKIDKTSFISVISKKLDTQKDPKFDSSLILRDGFNKFDAFFGEQFKTLVFL